MKPRWTILLPVLSILATLVMGVSVRRSITLTSFNAGELSPLMESRIDFGKYRAGARTLQNMIVRSQGPVTRRPGTKYIATVKDSTDAVRLLPFEYSTSDAYILELGDAYLRFHRNGAQVVDANDDAYELVAPWDANDIFEIQYTQDAQYMRFVHPDYQPYKLTRNSASHTDWTLSAITFTNGPFLDENETTTNTITPSATTGSITLNYSGATLFDADHVGALWEITHVAEANSVSGSFVLNLAPAGNPPSSSLFIEEDRYYDFSTHGSWDGTVKLQRSYDNESTWEDVVIHTSNFDGNIQYSGQEENDDAYYRVRLDDYTAGTDRSYCIYNLVARSFEINGVVSISAVTDANTATGTVIETLGGTTATYRWAEGAWSDYRGWPRTVEHHEQRCLYGGTDSYPQTIWASVTSSQDTDYDDFDEGEADEDDAWTYILPGMNPIQWLKSREYLMVGTAGGVGRLGSPDKPIDPTWPPTFRLQARNGAAYIQPVHAVDALLYVERGAEKVRELTYTYSSDRYVAPDMTILAEHIAEGGIVDIAFQSRPDPILWCVRSDGVLLSFTYQRHHDVQAWARHTTGSSDNFESVARIPTADTEDEVWAVVQRTIDSNSLRYVEQFQPFDWGTDQNDCWFVDCGGTTMTSMSQLEGATVSLFADGRPVESTTYTISSGAISPAASGYTNTTAGLSYTSIFETMPLVITGGGEDSLSRTHRVLGVTADFYETLGCHIGIHEDYVADILFSDDEFATTVDVFTGSKRIPFPRNPTRRPVIYLTESSPVPCTVRSYAIDLEATVD